MRNGDHSKPQASKSTIRESHGGRTAHTRSLRVHSTRCLSALQYESVMMSISAEASILLEQKGRCSAWASIYLGSTQAAPESGKEYPCQPSHAKSLTSSGTSVGGLGDRRESSDRQRLSNSEHRTMRKARHDTYSSVRLKDLFLVALWAFLLLQPRKRPSLT